MKRPVLVVVLLAAVAGCGGAKTVAWNIRFSPTTLAHDAAFVELSIYSGSTACFGPGPLYLADVPSGTAPTMPPGTLSAGTYTFCARARSATCDWIADGHTTVTIGTSPPDMVDVTLAPLAPTVAACPSGSGCSAGSCAGADGSALDAGGLDAGAPVDLGPCSTPRMSFVVAGGDHTCAVAPTSGEIWCWGANESGQLGDGTTVSSRVPVHAMMMEAATEVVAGASHTCAGTNTGAVYCWGANDHGQLGVGSAGAASPTPQRVPGSWQLGGLVAGGAHTCAALASDGGAVLHCWGANDQGELGLGDRTDRTAPMPLPVPTSFLYSTRVAVGAHHLCVTEPMDGGGAFGTSQVYCAGQNTNGQLGRGATTGDPTRLAPATGAAGFGGEVVVGDAHTCFAAIGGGVLCWGAGGEGRLGTGSTSDQRSPTAAPGFSSGLGPTLTAGAAFTCASQFVIGVDAGMPDNLYCWGDGSEGATALPAAQTLVPTLVAGQAVNSVAAGRGHACAIRTSDSAVICWGANGSGQLGIRSSADHIAVPTPVCFP